MRTDDQAFAFDEIPVEFEDDSDAGMETVQYADAYVDAETVCSQIFGDALLDALRSHRESSKALTELFAQTSHLGTEGLQQLAERVVGADPEWESNSPVRLFLERSGLHPAPASVETIALRALQELGAYHVPYAPPLTSVAAVVAFVERLDAALSTLAEGTAALSYAYLAENEAPRVEPRVQELAAQLLDWTAGPDAIDALRDRFTEMLVHHRQLVIETVTSVDRVLAALWPSAIERETSWSAKWNPLRHRPLWRELVRRHDALRRSQGRALGATLASAAAALGLRHASIALESADMSRSVGAPALATA